MIIRINGLNINGLNGPALELDLPGLTLVQSRALLAVALLANGSQPCSLKQLQQTLSRSINCVRIILAILKRKGWVDWQHGEARTIQIIRPLTWRVADEEPRRSSPRTGKPGTNGHARKGRPANAPG